VIVEVKVPVFAESIQEGTVLAWQRQPGDAVRRGDHLVDIETDKVVLEVVAPADGVLQSVLKPQGEAVSSLRERSSEGVSEDLGWRLGVRSQGTQRGRFPQSVRVVGMRD
jgi:2-oxoglutarate dehydrogenase E2 component (dihydrolipoamide succinyltransferase)